MLFKGSRALSSASLMNKYKEMFVLVLANLLSDPLCILCTSYLCGVLATDNICVSELCIQTMCFPYLSCYCYHCVMYQIQAYNTLNVQNT